MAFPVAMALAVALGVDLDARVRAGFDAPWAASLCGKTLNPFVGSSMTSPNISSSSLSVLRSMSTF